MHQALKPRPPIPAATRAAVVTRSQGRCEDCGEPASEMHHLTYETVLAGDIVDIFGREAPSDLAHLCHDCHRARHRDVNGTYWREQDERAAYWATYESEMDR